MIDRSHTFTIFISRLYADVWRKDAKRFYLRASVYPTRRQMIEAADTHDRRIGRELTNWENTGGMFQPSAFISRPISKRKWKQISPDLVGIIRLYQGNIHNDIVVHECVHAAAHMTRLQAWHDGRDTTEANLGDNCLDAEEAFAYCVGRMSNALLIRLEQLDMLATVEQPDLPPLTAAPSYRHSHPSEGALPA